MSAVDRLALKLAPSRAEPVSVMVAAFVPPEVGARIAIPGGEPVDQLHITLCFLGKTDVVPPEALAKVPAILEAVTRAVRPIPVALVGTGTFPPSEHSEGKVPFYARVDSPPLEQLRRIVAAAFTVEGVPYSDSFEYRPHVTLDYLPVGTPPPEPPIDESWNVDRLTMSVGEDRTQVPFGDADRLGVKLARAYVAPHIRVGPGGQRVSVESYWRQYRGARMASQAPDDEAKITKVTKVVDTREWDDDLDPPKPIAGSGSPRTCDRCNRSHEVHVFVQLDNGHEACIGSGCARKDEMGMVRKAVASATTVNRLEVQLAKATAHADAARAAWSEVLAMEAPTIVEVARDRIGTQFSMGDVHVWQHDEGPINEERRTTLIDAWREARLREATGATYGNPLVRATAVVEDLTKRLDRARRSSGERT